MSTIAIVRNVAFVGFLGGAAMLAAPIVTSPVQRTNLIAKVWRPSTPLLTPLPAPPSGPADNTNTSQAPPDTSNPQPSPQLDSKNSRAPDSSQAPATGSVSVVKPGDNVQALNDQAARNRARVVGSSTEFGPDQPAAEFYEKRLFDAHVPSTLGVGDDGIVSQTIVFRDGADITSTIMGVVQTGTPVHVAVVGDLNYLMVTFENAGVSQREYIYGAALKAKDAP